MKLEDDAAVRKFGRRIKDFAKKYTGNVAIHQLDEELLLVQYINFGGNYGHQILTTDGEYILDYDLYTKNEILAAKDGYVYLVDDTDPTSPRIVVYRFYE